MIINNDPNIELFKKLLTELPMIFYALDSNWIFTLSEGKGLAKLGRVPGEAVGRSAKEMYSHMPDIIESMQQAFNGESVHREHKLDDLYLDSYVVPIISDKGIVQGILGAVIDITERKISDLKFKKSQEFQQALVDSIPGLLYLYNADGELTFWNKQHETLTGYSSDELYHFKLLDWYPDDPKSQEAVIKGLENIQRDGFGQAEAELHIKNGSTLPFYFTACPLKIDEADYFVGVGIDISTRKKMEQELIELNHSLEKKVEHRTQQLLTANQELSQAIENLTTLNQDMRQMNEELLNQNEKITKMQNHLIETEKMAALGELVAGVAHEANTPIGVGITAATHLSDVVKDLLENASSKENITPYLEDIEDATMIIEKNLNRAGKLVQSFKKLSVDQSNEPKRKFDVGQYLDEILITLSPTLKKTNVHIEVEANETLIINGYPGSFAQIITNLVINSLNHAYDHNTPGTIRIKLESDQEYVKLTYSDDGKGMSPEVTRKIFDPFFTTQRGRGGTGLGLTVVYSIVTQQFNGSIECNSKLGEGTNFLIKLSTKGAQKHDTSN